jgi:DNA-binding PadR family transcriptional regulator
MSDSDSRSVSSISPQVFHILLSLVDDDLHGYAIIQDVSARTDGALRLTASTLYAAVKRLLESGWIAERSTRPAGASDDPRRRYYRLTKLGRDVARAEARRVEQLAAMARAKRLLPPLGAVAPKGSRA